MRQPGSAAADHGGPNDLEEIRLTDLPQITYFEHDGGPYLTAGVFLAREPDGGIPNLSFHRSQIISDTELRVRLGRSHHLTQYQAKAEARGEALEAAILLGPPLSLVLAAAAPLPYDENEMEVAGKIAGAPLKLRRCRTIDLDVPAETEIVIEGRILPDLRRPEGPFGEFMGYYVPVGDNHVFEVSAVTARRGALFHGLICGSPEDLRLLEVAVATRTYQALLAANLEGIIDVACVPFTMSTVVKIDQQYEGHARQVLLTAIGANHDWNKTVVRGRRGRRHQRLQRRVVGLSDARARRHACHGDARGAGLLSRSPARLLGPARDRRDGTVRPQAGIRAQAHSRRR